MKLSNILLDAYKVLFEGTKTRKAYPQHYENQSLLQLLKKYSGDDYFVRFSGTWKDKKNNRRVSEVGIKPTYTDEDGNVVVKPMWGNPRGIYCYWLDDVKNSKNADFATDLDTAFIIKRKHVGNQIDDIGRLSKSDYEKYTKKLAKYLAEQYGEGFNMDEYMDDIEYKSSNGSYGGLLFYAIVVFSRNYELLDVKQTYIWRNVLGVTFIGDKGHGIIHPSESSQALFLDSRAYEVIHKVDNRNIEFRKFEIGGEELLVDDVKDSDYDMYKPADGSDEYMASLEFGFDDDDDSYIYDDYDDIPDEVEDDLATSSRKALEIAMAYLLNGDSRPIKYLQKFRPTLLSDLLRKYLALPSLKNEKVISALVDMGASIPSDEAIEILKNARKKILAMEGGATSGISSHVKNTAFLTKDPVVISEFIDDASKIMTHPDFVLDENAELLRVLDERGYEFGLKDISNAVEKGKIKLADMILKYTTDMEYGMVADWLFSNGKIKTLDYLIKNGRLDPRSLDNVIKFEMTQDDYASPEAHKKIKFIFRHNIKVNDKLLMQIWMALIVRPKLDIVRGMLNSTSIDDAILRNTYMIKEFADVIKRRFGNELAEKFMQKIASIEK